MYYACLEFKDGHVEKKAFEDRKDARKYISENYNQKIHTSCWTE